MNGRGTRTPRKLRALSTMKPFAISLLALALLLVQLPSLAAEERGSVTNLPIPRYVSMKASEGNVRRGPSRTHRIDWIFKRRDTPLLITAEHGHWRRVQDRDGAGGWMHYTLLSGVRTVIVETDMLEMRARPQSDALTVAQLELGVVARIEECGETWCRLRAATHNGWVEKQHLWGVAPGETVD